MVSVRNLQVLFVDLNHVRLSWELRTTGEDPLDYDFFILKSGSSEGPFDVVAGPIRYDVYEFWDGDVNLQSRFRSYFYRIRALRRSTGETWEFPDGSVKLGGKPDLIALEQRRQERVLFREYIGRRCVLLPRRTFGRRCPRCWDSETGRKTIAKCLTCFDTSYVGGFWQPMEIFIQLDPNSKVQQNTVHGAEYQENTTGRMSFYPPAWPGCVIAEREGDRWRVVQVSTTQKLRAVIRQEMQLHRIVPGEIEYEFPIHWPDDWESAAERNFTNPQSPSDDLELPDYR